MISEFTKDKVFWSRKMNLKLVKFIESRPNIWNPKHHKYTSVAYRDRTYAEFARKYDNAFTGEAVKQRWTNIRSSFANYLRKVKAKQLKGDHEELKLNWYLAEPCQFLLKVKRNVKTNRHLMKSEQEDEDIETFSDVSNSNLENLNNEEESEIEIQDATGTSCENIANSLLQVFKGVQNDAFGIENSENGKVGRLVSKKLSEINSFDAAKATAKITEVLLLYHKDNPENPNNLKIY